MMGVPWLREGSEVEPALLTCTWMPVGSPGAIISTSPSTLFLEDIPGHCFFWGDSGSSLRFPPTHPHLLRFPNML